MTPSKIPGFKIDFTIRKFKNGEVYYLQKPIHNKIKYSYLSKTQAIYVCCESGMLKKQIKLLTHKTWHFVILEYFLKDKAIKEVVSEMDIITNLST